MIPDYLFYLHNWASFSDTFSTGSARNSHSHKEKNVLTGSLKQNPRIWSSLDWSILLPLPYELLKYKDRLLFLCLSFQNLSHPLIQRRHVVNVCWRKELIVLSCPCESKWDMEAITNLVISSPSLVVSSHLLISHAGAVSYNAWREKVPRTLDNLLWTSQFMTRKQWLTVSLSGDACLINRKYGPYFIWVFLNFKHRDWQFKFSSVELWLHTVCLYSPLIPIKE